MSNWVANSWPVGYSGVLFFVVAIWMLLLKPTYHRLRDRRFETKKYGIPLTDPRLSDEDIKQLMIDARNKEWNLQ